MGGGRRLARPVEAVVLARACAAAAAVCLVFAVAPFSATAPRGLGAALGGLGLLLAAALQLRRERIAARTLHLVVGLCTALVALCVATSTTAGGTATTAVGFTWIAAYSAVFHSRWGFRAHLAAVAVALAVGLALAPAQSPVHTWVFVIATIGGIGWMLNDKVARLRDDARMDGLTGVLSRGAFLDSARTAMALSARDGRPLTVALLDLDDFKQINDTRGHGAGDAVLAAVAAAGQAALRGGDLLGRLGGDEFALLLPASDSSTADLVLGRWRALGPGGVRWSAGTATWAGPPETLEQWLERADRGLYEAKRAARTAPPSRPDR